MIPFYQVDAFTCEPFHGNPAAVCLLSEKRSDIWMQAVAQEMNLSETAFLLPEADGYRLRWFTPLVEVDLCGHATLASAHILFETSDANRQRLGRADTARFYTRSGLLTAKWVEGWLELNFPIKPVEAVQPPEGLVEALGVSPNWVGKSLFDILVEVDDEMAVRQAKPDFALLKAVEARGVILTSRSSTSEYDFISRFFAPRVGVNEDPVTGSAHCVLVPYWAQKLGKTEFTAYQASKRGGVLKLRLDDGRVIIAGQAVTVLCGELVS
jgi:PhzF family phenazine biosynthesis protein